MEEIHFIDRLDQIKALSDPLRVRILEALTHSEMTTKQAADLLGEPPTKLYRHVETLHNAGLIELVRTNTVNGIVEKYYRAIASTIRVDQDLFTSGAPGEALQTATDAMIHLLETTMAEFRHTMQEKIEGQKDHSVTIHQTTITATELEAKKFNDKLKRLADEFKSTDLADGEMRYRFTGIVYPLDELEQTENLKETES